MKLKAKYRRLFIYAAILLSVVLLGTIGYFLFGNSAVKFTKDNQVEVNSVVDYTKFVEEVKDGHIEDLKIDSSKVNMKQLGEYTVYYHYDEKTYEYTLEVVDTQAPTFETQKQKVALHQTIDPKNLVKKVKDETKTTVQFKEDYQFNKVGEKEIEVVVSDEAKNTTTKKVKVEVGEDKKAPQLTVSDISFVVGTKINLKEIAAVKDDYDQNPTLTIEKGNFDSNKLGTYKVKYIAKDASGNQSDKTITVRIVEKTKENEKVVYLTFDDGPSKYTPEVLKILDKYNCKATFFITGMNAPYRKYIQEAHEKGHTIGLHTYSHKYPKIYASQSAYFEDLEKIGNLAKDYIGFVPKYIRFPGGGSNTISKNYSQGIMSSLTKKVEEKGYIYYDWNAENGDGRSKVSHKEMIKLATSSKATKIMMLMHDANGKQTTVDTLPTIIEYYQKRGYTFKAIDDSSIVPHQRVNN